MTIRPLISKEVFLLRDLQPVGWPDIVEKFTFYTSSVFCFPFKVTMEDVIVGIGTTIIHKDVAWLAHIIVHPAYRNNGIGTAVTQTLVDTAFNKECGTIYLCATELGAMVYEKLGFEPETEYLFFKDLKTYDGHVSDNIVVFREDVRLQILKMDKAVSGEDRMCSIENYLFDAYVYIRENSVEGFYLPSLGEGLIIAVTDKAGLELMKLRLKTKNDAVFPADNLAATMFMSQNGYMIFGKEKRMRFGKARNVSYANIYNRIAGTRG